MITKESSKDVKIIAIQGMPIYRLPISDELKDMVVYTLGYYMIDKSFVVDTKSSTPFDEKKHQWLDKETHSGYLDLIEFAKSFGTPNFQIFDATDYKRLKFRPIIAKIDGAEILFGKIRKDNVIVHALKVMKENVT